MQITTLALLLTGILIGAFLNVLASWIMGYLSPKSIADVLQWEILATPSLVGTKDRSFIAVWRVRGPDMTFETAEVMDSLADQVESLLRTLTENAILHVDSIRTPAREYKTPGGDVPAVAEVLDSIREEKYASGIYYENATYFALTISPGTSTQSFAKRLFYSNSGSSEDSYENLIRTAERIAGNFEANMPRRLRPERLSGSDLVSYLYQTYSANEHSLNRPPSEYPSLRYLFAHQVDTGFQPKVGDTYMVPVSIWGYPETCYAGIIEPLQELPFPYRYNNRLLALDQQKALKAVDRRSSEFQFQANDWLAMALGWDQESGNERGKDRYSEALVDEIQEIETEVRSGKTLLHHTGIVLVWDTVKERAEKKARTVKKKLRNTGGGFIVASEEGLGTEAYIGSLPGHGSQNPRRHLLLDEAAARLLPITGTYPGPVSTPCSFYETDDGRPPVLFYSKTREEVPFRFSPFGETGDVGHQMIVGPTGSGKSIFLQFQAMRQLHYEGGRSILFDRGYSFSPLCEALNGTHYDLSDADTGFMPFSRITEAKELRWAVSWVMSIFRMAGVDTGPTVRNRVTETLKNNAKAYQENGDPSYLTLRELQTQLQHPVLEDALEPFAGAGELNDLLNAEKDTFHDDDFIVIELGNLMEIDEHIFTPVLLYLFHKIESLLGVDRPTHVVADEFFVFAAESQEGREKLESALRTYRKKNAYVTIATQAPSDLTQVGLEGIVNSCESKILLPNPQALDRVQRDGYEELGLNDAEIAVIAKSDPKREYIAMQEGGTRRFDLELDAELAFMTEAPGHSLQDTPQVMRDFKSRYGPQWIYHWLKDRGYDDVLGHSILDHEGTNTSSNTLLLPPAGDGSVSRGRLTDGTVTVDDLSENGSSAEGSGSGTAFS